MLNINSYASAITDTWRYLLLNDIPLFILAIILTIFSLIGLIKQLLKKFFAYLLLVLATIIFTYVIIDISIFNYDVQNNNFTVYYGEFDYMQVSGNSIDTFEISNESNLYVRSVADLSISSGSHSGYLLYGKKSHWVIAYSNTPFE